MMPVRCFACGKVISALEQRYDALLAKGATVREALGQLGVKRPCCRTRFITRTESCTDVPAIEGEFVRNIARINRQCAKKRLILAR